MKKFLFSFCILTSLLLSIPTITHSCSPEPTLLENNHSKSIEWPMTLILYDSWGELPSNEEIDNVLQSLNIPGFKIISRKSTTKYFDLTLTYDFIVRSKKSELFPISKTIYKAMREILSSPHNITINY